MLTRTRSTTVALAALLALTVASCGSDDSSTVATPPTADPSTAGSSSAAPSSQAPSETPFATPSETVEPGPSISIAIDGDKVLPNAQEIELEKGEPLRLVIKSDRPGQLHVHSKPEQYVDFKAGTTDTELVIKVPGSVEVEEHDTSVVVALIRVR